MGRDALGHGHNVGEDGNPNHDDAGRFSSGGGGGGGGRNARAKKIGDAAVEHALLTKSGHLNAASKKAAENAGKQKWGKPHVTEVKNSKGPHQSRGTNSHPIAMYAGRMSVGTHESGGGGGGGGGGESGGGGGVGVRATGPMRPKHVRLTKAAMENVQKGIAVDERHKPTRLNFMN